MIIIDDDGKLTSRQAAEVRCAAAARELGVAGAAAARGRGAPAAPLHRAWAPACSADGERAALLPLLVRLSC